MNDRRKSKVFNMEIEPVNSCMQKEYNRHEANLTNERPFLQTSI